METLNKLKRRSTDLLRQAQQNMPDLPKDVGLPKSLPKRLPSLPAQFRRQRKTDAADIVRATWERVDIPSLPRASHSLSVVGGCAYIFGGETEPRQPVANDMHVIRLPFSSAGADYHKVPAKAAEAAGDLPDQPAAAADDDEQPPSSAALDEVPLEDASKGKGKAVAEDGKAGLAGDVPAPRIGHATAVIGSRIFLFGGQGGSDMKPLEEFGRVWVYDTRSHTWSYLDPVPAVKGGAIVPHPSPRSYHCATATDRPRDFPKPSGGSGGDGGPKKPQTWRQWALGDTSKTGIPQDPVVGHVAEAAVDEESEGYGTVLVHGGLLANGDRTSDFWAFDVRARTWTELPAAPGPPRSGSAICISKSRLYRFGGYDGAAELGGQLDFIHLELETFDDGHSKGEVSIHARSGWQTILQDGGDDDDTEQDAPVEIPVEPRQQWPAPRSHASLQALTVGGGKEYLVLCMGEREPGADDESGSASSDVWTFQVPPLGMSAASLSAAVYQALGRKTGEGKWERRRTGPHDAETSDELPSARARLASAPMTDVEEGGIFIWGGLGSDGVRSDDGWILRLAE